MQWMQQRMPLTSADRVLQKTLFSFDASVWEFYAPLLVGAQIVLAEPGGQQNPAYLVECMRETGVTRLQLVPSLLTWLVAEPGLSSCDALQTICCGGEALSMDLAARALLRPDMALYNLYGPTEATIDATYWQYGPDWPQAMAPIGQPIANTAAYVLDARGRPAPVGVEGELYLGGAGLARGYIQRPGLTAERFVPDAVSGRSGARLYRTGDRARWTRAGMLEYLGRADQQVKVRGFRIELEEIEAALRRHPQVREAALLLRQEDTGAQLAAYLVPSDGQPSVSELRAHLLQHVPDYMLPHAFVFVEALPRLPNGKLDRHSLANLAAAPVSPLPSSTPPRTEIETLLSAIWEDVLGLSPVGVHDNFFELGGDSLSAMRLVSQIRAAFGVDIPLRRVFEAPRIAELSKLIQTLLGGRASLPVPTRRASQDGDVPLSFAQERLWFLAQFTPGSAAYNMTTGVRVRGQLNEDA